MRAFTVAAALLVAGAQAAPALESRQVIYGCYFSGEGINNQYVSVGHDIDVTDANGNTRNLDCGTTSSSLFPTSSPSAHAINCPVSKSKADC
ncbi:hypothetical protein HER10_EVM0002675 [Colletotrichum scovillei]|uniref:uncharacterized protein n=1 Tax=Colletotrichum scovillei TaxID=1209932 RepID=UPI0015C3A9BB|nr:uncharacterized protein HER10_EVM0002675 [Colletotrichum scovillei]KAF4779305.1 hypothetical protein HER10_EVM0002675 [Colletotrichum scovillei]